MKQATFIQVAVVAVNLSCFFAGHRTTAANPEPMYGPALKPVDSVKPPINPAVVIQPQAASKTKIANKKQNKKNVVKQPVFSGAKGASTANPNPIGPDGREWEQREVASYSLEFQGNNALKRGDLESAKTLLQRAIQLNIREYDAWIELGQVYDTQGQPNEAFAAYRNGFGSPPGSTMSGYDPALARNAARYGMLCEAAGQQEAAVQAYDAARRYDELENNPTSQLKVFPDPSIPSSSEVLAMLQLVQAMTLEEAYIYEGRDRSADALASYQEALRLLPNDPVTQLYWGRGLKSVKRYDEAKAAFKQAALLDSGGIIKAAAQEDLDALTKSGH